MVKLLTVHGVQACRPHFALRFTCLVAHDVLKVLKFSHESFPIKTARAVYVISTSAYSVPVCPLLLV